jgi:DNA repair protein RecO (recombination protein O)
VKLESVGIIIGLRPFGERDAVAHIFTRDFGVLVGMMRGAIIARKNKPLVGQVGAVSWNARLDSMLGVFHFEAQKNLAAPLMINGVALGYMNSAFALLCALLPEREKYEALYDETELLLKNMVEPAPHLTLAVIGVRNWMQNFYLSWEINLLRELGYALNLSRCSNCGRTDDLTHLSPRTARAVCSECARPYLDKLWTLPVDLNITARFIQKIIAEQGGKELPMARGMVRGI